MQGPSCHVPDPSGKTCCAEVMRWLIRPTSDPSSPIPSANITDFNRISSNLGAAVAYAMTYAYQNTVSPGSNDCMQHLQTCKSILSIAGLFALPAQPSWEPCKI